MARFDPAKIGTRCECGAPYINAGVNSGYGCSGLVRAAQYRLSERRRRYAAARGRVAVSG